MHQNEPSQCGWEVTDFFFIFFFPFTTGCAVDQQLAGVYWAVPTTCYFFNWLCIIVLVIDIKVYSVGEPAVIKFCIEIGRSEL